MKFNLSSITVILCCTSIVNAAELYDFERDVRPILTTHCVKCHGPQKQGSEIRFDTLSTDLIKDRPAAETWHDARDVIHLGEMPPEDEAPLSSVQRQVLTGWIDQQLQLAIDASKSTGGEVVLRRLNRVEYQNTMTDLLGVTADYAANLPPDTPSEQGFKNNGDALSMSALQFEYYLESARTGLSRAIVTGPAPEVFSTFVTDSATNVKKTLSSSRLGAKGTFVARLDQFPTAGDFVVRIKARAELVDGVAYPQMKAVFGFRADTQTPARELGVIDVTSEEVQEFEFHGRMEDFPVQSKTQSKYPGQLIWVSNAFNDGKPLKKKAIAKTEEDPTVNKKRKRGLQEVEYDNFPIIFVESVEFIGPLYDEWPPSHHVKLLPLLKAKEQGELIYAKEVLTKFMMRAYRRPVESEEIRPMLRLFSKIRPTVETFEEAIREAFTMVLVSPEFLYLVEPESGNGSQKSPLNDFELASRLSYFLWSTMPDERLFELAGRGELSHPDKLAGEVDRLLSDARSWSFIEQFSDQWLDLGAVDRVAVNPEYYRNWDITLEPHMQEESRRFFAEILRQDLSALNLLDSEFAMWNARLATHYGFEYGPRGNTFERVDLPNDSVRGGLLTQASILLGNSTGEDSHPILRAVWIRERLLDDPPAPPPPNVPALDSENADFSMLSIRKQLELHREQASCNDCHRGIDPWGIALESFDAVGNYRTAIRRKSGNKFVSLPIDDQTELPGGHRISGVEELKQYLLTHRKAQFARSVVTHLTSYALGRSLEFTDEPAIDELTAAFVAHEYKLRPLILSIVQSELFQMK